MREEVRKARKQFDSQSKLHRKACCERCGMTLEEHNRYGYGQLQVHHKLPIKELGAAANDPTNYHTLCKFCHDGWHKFAEKLDIPYETWFRGTPEMELIRRAYSTD